MYQDVFDKLVRGFDEYLHSVSSLDTFFPSAELAANLKEIVRILKMYNDVWEECLPMIVQDRSRKS